MAEILRPRSLRELFNQTFDLVFGNLPALVAIQVIFWLPVSVLNYFVASAVGDIDVQVDSTTGVVLSPDVLISVAAIAFNLVIGLIVNPIMSAASMLVISDRFMGREASVGTAIGLALRRFVSLIMVGFVVNVCAIVCLTIGYGVLLASTALGGLGAIVGLLFALACTVLSIRILVTFSVVAPAVNKKFRQ